MTDGDVHLKTPFSGWLGIPAWKSSSGQGMLESPRPTARITCHLPDWFRWSWFMLDWRSSQVRHKDAPWPPWVTGVSSSECLAGSMVPMVRVTCDTARTKDQVCLVFGEKLWEGVPQDGPWAVGRWSASDAMGRKMRDIYMWRSNWCNLNTWSDVHMFTFAFVTGFQNVVMFTMLFCILSILHDANDLQMYRTFTTWKSIVTTMLHVVYTQTIKADQEEAMCHVE